MSSKAKSPARKSPVRACEEPRAIGKYWSPTMLFIANSLFTAVAYLVIACCAGSLLVMLICTVVFLATGYYDVLMPRFSVAFFGSLPVSLWLVSVMCNSVEMSDSEQIFFFNCGKDLRQRYFAPRYMLSFFPMDCCAQRISRNYPFRLVRFYLSHDVTDTIREPCYSNKRDRNRGVKPKGYRTVQKTLSVFDCVALDGVFMIKPLKLTQLGMAYIAGKTDAEAEFCRQVAKKFVEKLEIYALAGKKTFSSKDFVFDLAEFGFFQVRLKSPPEVFTHSSIRDNSYPIVHTSHEITIPSRFEERPPR